MMRCYAARMLRKIRLVLVLVAVGALGCSGDSEDRCDGACEDAEYTRAQILEQWELDGGGNGGPCSAPEGDYVRACELWLEDATRCDEHCQ
jgi:hypothetical protein